MKHLSLHHHQFLIYDAHYIYLHAEHHLHMKYEDFVKPVVPLMVIDCVPKNEQKHFIITLYPKRKSFL